MQSFVKRKTDAQHLLQNRRQDMGMREQDIARKAGMSKSTYRRRVEHPEDLTVRELNLLAMILHFSNEEILQIINNCK